MKFEDYIKEGIVKKISPDIARAQSLIEDAEKRKKFIENTVEKLGISDDNANYYVEQIYDVLIQIIRAKLLTEGYKAAGKGAHKAEISFLQDYISEKDLRFLDDLRYFRNGIKYYGKRFDKDYAEKVIEFMNRIYPELKEI